MLLVGCGGSTGFLIKPVPIDERLQETVIAKDAGWSVTNKIAIIDVEGLLLNARSSELFGSGENPVSLFVEKMDRAAADDSVKAVVLRINSPGGGVNASDIMYQRVLQLKVARHIPVVAAVEDVGASGGYYIACGADTIMASPTSITGSIGVIVQSVSFAGTMSRLGIDAKAIVSGRFKDMASPLKPLDPKDEALLQGIVDQFYGRFLKVVQSGRPKLSADRVKELADGRVYTGQQAMDVGLVDTLGHADDAVLLAKKLSKSDKVKVVIYHRPLGYKANVYSAAQSPAPQMNVNINLPNVMELIGPQFLYLWSGHTPR